MAGSSSSQSSMELSSGKSYVIKPRTVNFSKDDLTIQVESPVDFKSLQRHGVDIASFMEFQNFQGFFSMLNGPTYKELVKDFWVRAEVYDKHAALAEERQKVAQDPTLKGKSREEMGLPKYKKTEIRSSVMGVPVLINEESIARAIRCSNNGKFQWNVSRNSDLVKASKELLHGGRPSSKVCDMNSEHRVLHKILMDCFFQRGGASDQIPLDHLVFLFYIIKFEKVNLPRYIFNHLVWAIWESQGKKQRKLVPYGRLLSEIFYQGGLINALKTSGAVNDEDLDTCCGKLINGKTLHYMKIASKYVKYKDDLKESYVVSDLMIDFPPICKHDNPEVIYHFIKRYYEDTGIKLTYSDLPEVVGGDSLKIATKRRSKKEDSEESESSSKKAKTESGSSKQKEKALKSPLPAIQEDASEADAIPEPLLKRKRSKAQSSLSEEVSAAFDAVDNTSPGQRVQKKKKKQAFDPVMPMVVVSETEKRVADNIAKTSIQHSKDLKKAKKVRKMIVSEEVVEAVPESTEVAEATAGVATESAEETLSQRMEKVADDLGIPVADVVKRKTVVAAKKALDLTHELEHLVTDQAAGVVHKAMQVKREAASDAGSSEAVQGKISSSSTTFNTVSDNPTPEPEYIVIPDDVQSNSPFSTILNSSPTALARKSPVFVSTIVDQMTRDLQETRHQICETLPSDHWLQPPVVMPLQTVFPDSQKKSCQAEVGTSNSDPKHSTNPESPPTLHALEKHLGGEFPITPQKASDTAPEKAVSELKHQHQPKATQKADTSEKASETEHETAVSEIQQQQQPNSQIPTKVSEKAIPISPTQPETINQTDQQTVQTANLETTLCSDSENHHESESAQNLSKVVPCQPSSSHQPDSSSPDLLDTVLLDSKLMNILSKVKELAQLRTVPLLSICYEEQWYSLKTQINQCLDDISQKCIAEQAEALAKHLEEVNKAETAKSQILFLANEPFYPDKDYVSHDAKLIKNLKQKILTIQEQSRLQIQTLQEEARIREEAQAKKTEALEEIVRKQAEDVAQLMAMMKNQAQP